MDVPVLAKAQVDANLRTPRLACPTRAVYGSRESRGK